MPLHSLDLDFYNRSTLTQQIKNAKQTHYVILNEIDDGNIKHNLSTYRIGSYVSSSFYWSL